MSDCANYDQETGALTFKGFVIPGHPDYLNIAGLNVGALSPPLQYLYHEYHVKAYQIYGNFLFLQCPEHRIPPLDNRPASVCEYIAVWTGVGQTPTLWSGELAPHWSARIDARLEGQLVSSDTDSQELVLYLANQVFTRCTGLTLLCARLLVVELPRAHHVKHTERINDMPWSIGAGGVVIQYHNGHLPLLRRTGVITSWPGPKYSRAVGVRYALSRDPPCRDLLNRELGIVPCAYRILKPPGDLCAYGFGFHGIVPTPGSYSLSKWRLADRWSRFDIPGVKNLAHIARVQRVVGTNIPQEGDGKVLDQYLYLVG